MVLTRSAARVHAQSRLHLMEIGNILQCSSPGAGSDSALVEPHKPADEQIEPADVVRCAAETPSPENFVERGGEVRIPAAARSGSVASSRNDTPHPEVRTLQFGDEDARHACSTDAAALPVIEEATAEHAERCASLPVSCVDTQPQAASEDVRVQENAAEGDRLDRREPDTVAADEGTAEVTTTPFESRVEPQQSAQDTVGNYTASGSVAVAPPASQGSACMSPLSLDCSALSPWHPAHTEQQSVSDLEGFMNQVGDAFETLARAAPAASPHSVPPAETSYGVTNFTFELGVGDAIAVETPQKNSVVDAPVDVWAPRLTPHSRRTSSVHGDSAEEAAARLGAEWCGTHTYFESSDSEDEDCGDGGSDSYDELFDSFDTEASPAPHQDVSAIADGINSVIIEHHRSMARDHAWR